MSSALLAAYHDLPAADRAALALLVMVQEPLNRSALCDWLKAADLRDEAKQRYSTTALIPLLERWQALGLMEEAPPGFGTGHRPSSAFSHALLAELLPRPESGSLVELVRRVAPVRRPYGWEPEEGPLFRELVLATHLGFTSELERELKAYRPRRDEPKGQLLLRTFGLSVPSSGLKRLGLERAELYLGRVLEYAMEELLPVDAELLRFMAEAGELMLPRVAALGAQYLALRGEFEPALGLLAGRADPASTAAHSFVALARGHWDDARQQAARAVDGTRAKKSGRLKGLEPGPLWPWALFALLTDRENALALALAREQLALSAKRDPTRHVAVMALASFERLRGGQAITPDPWAPSALSYARSWSDVLLWTLTLRFAGEPLAEGLASVLSKLAQQARARGFAWLADELARAGELARADGLVRLYVREEPWERVLRSLDAVIERAGAPEPAAGAGGEARLAWTLAIEPDGLHQVAVRVQSRTPSGFTSGRQVTWKWLHELPLDTPWVTADDRRVLQHLMVVRDYHRGGQSVQLSPDAPAGLVGHPRVFADHECRAPIEVVRGEPRVEVTERGEQLIVTLAPRACLERDVVCERDGAARVVVYARTLAQRLIAAELSSGGLSLPAHARDRMAHVLGKLTRHFAVASELAFEAENLEEVAADPRLHVQLRRTSAGLSLRPCVVPLGVAPLFAPGVGNAVVLASIPGELGLRAVRATRDLEAEQRRLADLLAACPSLREAERHGTDYRIGELTRCLELVCELRALGDEVLVEWPDGQAYAVVGERGLRDLRLRVKDEGAWLAADGELEVDEELKLTFHELLARKQARHGRFVTLDDGRFVALSAELERALAGAEALAQLRGERVELHPVALFGVTSLAEAALETDSLVAERLRRARQAALLTPDVPATFEAALRPYQQEGYAWLSRLAHWGAGACLADDMGLGKTLQALALLVEHAPRGPSLVVAPTSVCGNWLDEARKFAPSLRVVRLGAGERGRTLSALGAFDVLVCSYGVLQQESKRLAARRFQVVVLDEAQAIKNATTLRARAARGLSSEMRVALTGTPVENHLGELWSILNFLNPGLLGTPKAFEERFLKPIQRDGDRDAAELLKRIVQPFVLRRQKREVLADLPEKTVITLRVEPSEEERALFAALREQALARTSRHENHAQARIHLLAELTRLRRAACHPDLVAPEAGLTSSKLSTLERLLLELREGGHRALVFSQFVDYLTLVRRRLEALGLSYQYLDGSSTPDSRAASVRAFQAGEGDVFLISLKAGGFGLNLTAADYVVHLDPWWNPAVEDQASDRAHRIGQTRPVTIYRLVMAGSVEEKILALHAEKRDLADDVLEGTGSGRTVDVEGLVRLLEEAHAEPAKARPVVARGLSDMQGESV